MITRHNAHWLLAAALTGAVSFTALADGLTGKSGATFRMTLSKENPNLISVKGDPITAITDPNGSLTDQKQTGNGVVTVLAGGEKPFTLVLETRAGNSYLVNVTPRTGMGASYIIHGTEPQRAKATRRWEEKTPYESVLVDIHQAIAAGRVHADQHRTDAGDLAGHSAGTDAAGAVRRGQSGDRALHAVQPASLRRGPARA